MLDPLLAQRKNTSSPQGNISNTYQMLGRIEDCLRMRRDVYSGCVKHHGEEQVDTLRAANNYAKSLIDTLRFTEAKNLLRKKRPVARRSLGENDETTLRMSWYYAVALYMDPAARRGPARPRRRSRRIIARGALARTLGQRELTRPGKTRFFNARENAAAGRLRTVLSSSPTSVKKTTHQHLTAAPLYPLCPSSWRTLFSRATG